MKHILVIDPDVLIRRMVFNSLGSGEFQVHHPDSVREAQSWLERHEPNLILLGAEILEKNPTFLEELSSGAPVCLMVEQGQEVDPAHKDYVADVLEKPFSPMALVRTAHRLLGAEADSAEMQPLQDLERQQLLLYARDLTRLHREDERKTQQLKAAHARLQEFEKMKDMFLALVSHELRTPLTIIKGNSHLMRRMLRGAEPGSKEEKLLSFAEGLAAGSQRLESLVHDLMSYSSVRSGVTPFELRPLDLRAVILSVLQDLENTAKAKNVSFDFDQPRHDIMLLGDSGRLKEAFSHVVKNAILYNVPNGVVLVRCNQNGEQVTVSIVDTGPGISPEEREKVFHPFYQAQDVLTRRVEGIGLGLAITRHIVESHGGRIQLVGELGRGTEVVVNLPVAPPDVPSMEFAPISPEEFEQQLSAKEGDTDAALSEYARELYAAFDRERVKRRLLEDQYREMENTFLETLAALMRQVGMRDMHRASHVDRVMFYASEIARRIDPSLPQKKDFQLSLVLHDIGKIGVAESLLQKVGRLTDDEQRQLRAHASMGADFLQSIEYLQPALISVRHHHERWDGKGYPDGLKGTEIPLWARIIAVADSFDAMVSDRPYRKALTPEEARVEIEKNAGTQFDPDVVQAFLEGWDTVRAVAAGSFHEVFSPPA